MNLDVMTLSHAFDLLYHESKLHGSCGEARRYSCELKGLILTVKPLVFSRAVAYGNVKVGIPEI